MMFMVLAMLAALAGYKWWMFGFMAVALIRFLAEDFRSDDPIVFVGKRHD